MLAAVALLVAQAGCGADGETPETPPTVTGCGFPDDLVADATAEGEVTLFAAVTDPALAKIAAHFEDVYDITVIYSRQAGGELIQSVEASLEAGVVPADTLILSDLSVVRQWSADGVLAELDIPNADQLIEGLRDEERFTWPFSFYTLGILYNSARIDEADVPASWAELAELPDDRLVAFANPATAGGALNVQHSLTEIMGADYIGRFADRSTLVTENSLSLDQFILTGEADFGVPALENQVLSQQAAGEPVAMVYPEEGIPAGALEVGALADSPNPNAGRLLAQWLLCSDYQDVAHELGFRPVLTGSPIPDGAEDLTSATLFPLDANAIAEQRQDVIDRFADALG
jgi:iron(III) transport system substrate-binding protein